MKNPRSDSMDRLSHSGSRGRSRVIEFGRYVPDELDLRLMALARGLVAAFTVLAVAAVVLVWITT